MASIAMIHESPRAVIVDGGILPIIHTSLSHPSYGVRATACQLTRALSRSVAILRTSLIDGGVATKILDLLKEEEGRMSRQSQDAQSLGGTDESNNAVLIAGTAALCNLVTEFSPMQKVRPPVVPVKSQALIGLDRCSSIAVAWTCSCGSVCRAPNKHARTRYGRSRICSSRTTLTTSSRWSRHWVGTAYERESGLPRQPGRRTANKPCTRRQITHHSPDIQEQGLALMRNFICEGTEEEISALFDGIGEQDLLVKLLLPKLQPDVEVEPMEQVGGGGNTRKSGC